MYIHLDTQRLRIRPIVIEDADFILKLVNSEGWLQFIGDRNIADKKDAEAYIKKLLDNPNFYYSVFELKTAQKAIGIVTFLKRDDEKFYDIGFALINEFEKNGYGFEATTSYLQKLKDIGIHKQVIAITLPENQKSIRLLQKLGFTYTKTSKKEGEMLSYYHLKW